MDRPSFQWKFVLCLLLQFDIAFAETYTGACVSVITQMQACASRWDSVRIECTKAVKTNTIWPGPCECGYYANDLPCFDEWEVCAAQAWTQVPQWFRDGVTSCVQKDSQYTIRAQLGPSANPFSLDLTRSILTTPSTPRPDAVETQANSFSNPSSSLSITTASPSPSSPTPDPILPNQTKEPLSELLSRGAQAGIGVGVSIFVIIVLGALIAIVMLKRRRFAKVTNSIDSGFQKPELDGKGASADMHEIFEARGRQTDMPLELEAPQRSEVAGSVTRYELGDGGGVAQK